MLVLQGLENRNADISHVVEREQFATQLGNESPISMNTFFIQQITTIVGEVAVCKVLKSTAEGVGVSVS